MATKKDSSDLTRSQLNAGDEHFDFCCSKCDKRKLRKQALKYCVHCSEYYCTTCVDNHNEFPAMADHVMTDPQPLPPALSRSGSRLQAAPTEVCRRHRLKLVDMYCGDHKCVGCSVCFLLEHKSCTDIHYVPEFIKTGFPSKHVKRINTRLAESINDMQKLKTIPRDQYLDNSKTKRHQEVKDQRKEIDTLLNDIEKNTLAELDTIHQNEKSMITNSNQNLHEVHSEMVRLKSQINSDNSNDSQKFVSAMLGECLINDGKELTTEISNNPKVEIEYTPNAEIVKFLKTIKTLGVFTSPLTQTAPTQPAVTTTTGTKPKTTAVSTQPISSDSRQKTTVPASALPSSDTRQKTKVSTSKSISGNMKSQKQGLYKIVNKSEYNVRQQDDENTCSIWSSCIVNNDSMVLVDYCNKKVKLLNTTTYTISSSLVMNSEPLSVCRVNNEEVAVCLNNCTIQFVGIQGDQLVHTRSLSMKHGCRCAVVINDRIYVGYGNIVYIYTLDGHSVGNIVCKDSTGNNPFSRIEDISVSKDGGLLHVADYDKGVITITITGQVQWQYAAKELSRAHGICPDDSGGVIVCGFRSHNVIQLSSGGEYMGNIVTSSDGIYRPISVSYNKHKHELVVGLFYNDSIKVFKLK